MNSIVRPGWVCRVCAARIPHIFLHQQVGATRTFTATAPGFREKSNSKKITRFADRSCYKGSQSKDGDKFRLLKRLIIHRFQGLIDSENTRFVGASDKIDPAHTKQFINAISESCDLASKNDITTRAENPLFFTLRSAFVEGNVKGLDKEIKYSFSKFLFNTTHDEAITSAQLALANFQHPEEWYPATRALQRTVHLHVGPTNSGKTYHALQALQKAKSGVYAGPLRLLAHEVYSRFQSQGIPVALVTGEEQRFPDADNYLVACTVEMSPLNQILDVAVIDEIQMIADNQRGWAWTSAVLGLMAKELHLCGEERSVDIIKSICAKTGDKLVIHRYERLNTLETMPKSLDGNYRKLEKGDAIVSFSRVGLWALKRSIERKTGKRCAIVYGGLPPETRAQQAALFNDPDNDYDFIAASDAIGMGLNLSIKRVIFESVAKNDGTAFRLLNIPEIKQIGGRAGRYRTAAQQDGSGENKGYVTALEPADLPTVKQGFESNAPTISSAGLQLPSSVVERFAKYFPDEIPLSFILLRLRDICSTSSQYHLCDIKESIEVADLIQEYEMPVSDRLTFLAAPVNTRDQNSRTVVKSMARAITELSGGHLLDIDGLDLDLIEQAPQEVTPKFLGMLEALHRALGLYLWLSYRFPNLFVSQTLAFHAKGLLETRINSLLSTMRFDEGKRQKLRQHMRAQIEKQRQHAKDILGDQAEAEEEQMHHYEVPGSWNEEGHEEPVMQNMEEAEALIKPEQKVDPALVGSGTPGSGSGDRPTTSP
ncbi:hypothetical protein MKZ38_003593 [Zalerion maritima]|uniref:RNA helicase n=1 Tax=Zalerion maritima TaxID=339359 RepID=A0AAD5WSA7_9PEZI|nr:hypothetical protein MKZ38_003593 [Zalerion maritima]